MRLNNAKLKFKIVFWFYQSLFIATTLTILFPFYSKVLGFHVSLDQYFVFVNIFFKVIVAIDICLIFIGIYVQYKSMIKRMDKLDKTLDNKSNADTDKPNNS